MAAIIIAFTAAGLGLISVGAFLGHDEAVYALRARAFALSKPYRFFWGDYRAPGLPGVLSLLWTIRPTEPYLRAAVLAFGGMGLVTTWWLGRHLFDRITAVIAAALVACMPGYLVASTQVWPDVPGAVLGLGAILVFAAASAGPRVRWWAVLTVVPAAAATVVRYGAPLPIGVGYAVVALCRWPAVRRSLPQTLLTATLTAMVCLGLLLVPELTGSLVAPWAAINALQAGQDFAFHQSFVDFARQAPRLLGIAVGPLVVVGGGLLFRQSRRRGLPARSLAMAAATAVGTVLGLALVLGHGEWRYLMPAVPWVAVLGAAGLAWPLRNVSYAARPAVVALAVPVGLAVLAAGIVLAREPHVAQKRSISVLRAAS
ncbi:MAG: glycosyltransferase family 39 protein, partial [Actinomycetota bacterium]|nr:glycosyltransferase family 39 protein [Actinomycetota bacterium]